MTKISDFLNAQLDKKEITKYELGKQAGIDRTALGRFFSGEREPGTANFIKICQVLKPSNKELSDFIKNF